MEDKHEQVKDNDEDIEDEDNVSSESSLAALGDEDGLLASGNEDGACPEEPLTEEEVEELVSELIEIESKAAEAQEALERESLEKVEHEVREELSQTLNGDDLERAVADEMATLKEEWEAVLDELEVESADLLEQLDGAGVDLPNIYKWIESQIPNGCCTEAWKKRTHWAGSQVAGDAVESISNAEKQLQELRPVRRRLGKVLEEGASGYLEKKIAAGDSSEIVTDKTDVNWDSFLKMVSTQTSEENVSFGSKHWASVYLASTPQQAAVLGINFPGVDEVEEIAEIDGNSADPFVADAIANEKELDLSEAQRKNYRKVKEDEDANIDRKLQIRLKQRRNRKRTKQDRSTNDISIDQYVGDNLENPDNADNKDDLLGSCAASTDMFTSQSSTVEPIQSKVVKHEREASEDCNEAKRQRTIIPGDDDAVFLNEDDCVPISCHQAGEGDQPVLQENEGDFVGAGSKSEMENLHCTICGELVTEVLRHPLLEVIVCGKCKSAVEAKMSNKDHGSSLCYCAWCGRSSDLINCKSCKMLFCIPCINRHLGKEYLLEIKSSGWKCCKCSPSILRRLILEFKKATGSTDLTIASSGSGSDDSDDSDDSDARPDVSTSSSVRHKKIRRIIDDTELGEETKKKIAIEKERQQRLKSLQAQFSSKTMEMNAMASTGILPEGASSEVLGDVSTGFIVNVVREKGEDAVRIPSSLSAKLKVHQIAGIRFMWENIIQSIRKVRAGDKGLGCILAHTMGLGKTFQVIAFLYTAMRVIDLGLRCALIVTPVNVLHNWRQEFAKWAPSEYKPLRVYMLDDVPRERRAELLRKWKRKGGVFLIGYTAFRNLSLGKNAKDYEIAKQISSALKEGPDILVCDEAHMIKNNGAEITQALKQVQCQRRIALTGSPLQNNLMEYYCMVDFVREGFLGSSHEFRNRFQNPIENGQHTNSTADDVRIMNQRSHILYEQLKGFVQRMDMSVVKKDLPPKTVFVVAVKLSPLQRKLYKKFLDVHGFTKNKDAIEGMRRRNMFAGYQALAQVWNHPWILKLMKERGYAKREVVESFLPEDGSSDENMDYNVGTGEKSKTTNASLQKNATSYMLEGWWNDLLNGNNYREADYSGKMVLLLDILTMASDMGDKTLVFSQSISTLDLIEFYLTKLPQRGKVGKCWKRGKDWYRIDGKTEGYERQRLVDVFNDPRNKRVKCTLISTKAGSLGINLYAANRVIIVDGSWNPTYDLQAIYRAWRYGQKKPVYAYRLMAHGTMEEKIYKRQVTKEGLAARVVDRQQVYRTISKEEMLHLFAFGDDENIDTLSKQNGHVTDTMSENVGNLLKQKSAASGSCSDKLMEKLLSRHCPRWIANYHEHETLLQENEDEKLTKEEQDMAWEVYRRSMEWEEVQRGPVKSSLDGQNINPGTTPQPQPKPSSVDPPAVQENRSASIPQEQVKKIPLIPLSRLRFRTTQRQCTTTAHMLTLRCQGTKPGCTTFCGECGKEIRWEDLTGKSSR